MKKPSLNEARKRSTENVNTVFMNDINEKQKNLGLNKKYFIKTYGCQMNEHDSENIKAILEKMGFTEVIEMEESDLIILNTCAIRENVHDKVFGLLGHIKPLRAKKEVMVALCGCMAQEENVVDKIVDKYKWLDIVFGTHNINNLPSILEKAYSDSKQTIEVLSCEGDIVEDIPVKRDNSLKAWVNIMYGCDKFCAYCIVPYTRGKQRSRDSKHIVKEVENLIKEGYQEVTLLGQNVNAYGKDLNTSYTMANLLEDVAKTGINRIRFVTSHPWDFSDDMIDVITKYDNVMPYIHLPLQSGSDDVLKAMRRRYTKDSYLELFSKLKSRIPHCSITTDIIVGFPGETEKDFEDTLEVVNKCKFDSAFTFIFSPREGTPAASMEDNISIDEKNQRLYKLNELINKYSKENNDKYVGTKVKVLLESISEKKPNKLKGYTETMKLVNVEATPDLIGTIVEVEITSVKTWSMDGILV